MTTWDRISWTHFRNLINRYKVVALLPVGSVEQHGPHLPLGTDYILADSICSLTAERAKDAGEDLSDLKVLKLPPITYGLSSMWAAYEGTISVGTEAFAKYVGDVLRAVVRGGVKYVVIVNGHYGNSDALRLVARDIAEEVGGVIAVITLWDLIGDVINKLFKTKFFHADEIETSLALALNISLEGKPSSPEKPFRLYNNFWHSLDLTVRPKVHVFTKESTSKHGPGAFGRPDHASRSKGELLLNSAVSRLIEFIKYLVKSYNT